MVVKKNIITIFVNFSHALKRKKRNEPAQPFKSL